MNSSLKILTLTKTKEAGKYFACFSVEISVVTEPEQNLLPSIGIGMKLIDFVYASDGFQVSIPK